MGITTTPMGHTRLRIVWYLGHGHTSKTPQSWHANAIRIVNRKIVILKAGMAASLHPPPIPCSLFTPSQPLLAQLPAFGESGLAPQTSTRGTGKRESGLMWTRPHFPPGQTANVVVSPVLARADGPSYGCTTSGSPTKKKKKTTHSQKPGQAIKRQRERRLQCHGGYYNRVYFPVVQGIQLHVKMSLSSYFTAWL